MAITRMIKPDDALVEMHPVNTIEPIENETSREAEALVHVLMWITKVSIPTHISARAKTLLVALGKDSTSWAEIARQSDITREAVRLMAKELERDFGLRSCNSRRNGTRAKCRRSRNQFLKSVND